MVSREYGNVTDCADTSVIGCYDECRHAQSVLDAMPPIPILDGDGRLILYSWIEGILANDDAQILEMCQWTPDACMVGEAHGFGCVQCIVSEPAFQMCAPDSVVCGVDTYTVVDPCYSFCTTVCNTVCKTVRLDWSADADLSTLYADVIAALAQDYTANWKGIDEFAFAVFGGNVVKYENGAYYVLIGRALNDKETAALVTIAELFPTPPNSRIVFVI